jgi:hypothetical protein
MSKKSKRTKQKFTPFPILEMESKIKDLEYRLWQAEVMIEALERQSAPIHLVPPFNFRADGVAGLPRMPNLGIA